MKKLFTLIALAILVSTGSFAQKSTRYAIVAFHKLQPGKTMDDAIAIEKQWAQLHQVRKNAGVISDWIMYVPYNGMKSEGIDFDYITVNGGTDLDKLHTYPMEIFAEMTKADPSRPFTFLMEASMLGVGVGFDDKAADKDFQIYEPQGEETYVVPDTREGWVKSLEILINSCS